MGTVSVQRVREYVARPRRDDNVRVVLVDRLWPRGISKAELPIDEWARGAAPSTELRKWFAHDPEKWPEFRRRYADELDARKDDGAGLVDAQRAGDVLLLFDAKDTEHSQAVVLAEWLRAAAH